MEGAPSPFSEHEDVYVKSQAHLLKPTTDNPLPTAVPPPTAALAGLLGVRHVLVVVGLPERGKCFISQRLSKYLYFFHGAEVKLFDVAEYMGCETCGEPGVDCHDATTESRIAASADALTHDLKAFLDAADTSRVAGGNMSVPRNPQTAQARAAEVAMQAAREEIQDTEQQLLVDETDRRQKNVDSGKVAIIFTSDGMRTFYEKWAGTSKERRRWAAETLRRDRNLAAKLIFIEVIVTSATLMERNLRAKFRHERRLASGEGAADHMRHTVQVLSATDAAAGDAGQSGSAAQPGPAGQPGEQGAVSLPGPNGGQWTAAPAIPAPAASVPISSAAPTLARRTMSDSSDNNWAAAAGLSLDDESAEIPASRVHAFHQRVNEFARVYVSLQADGSEDDLSYIKLINYGQQVVTNRMHGYLRMRIAQFLTVIHPAPHTIYLTRHGQSAYNVLGKIGGNPPLSPAGDEYARRLGEWVTGAICYQHAGKLDSLTKARLWTSSLQRTILTAMHIPHPIITNADLGKPLNRPAFAEADLADPAASSLVASPPRSANSSTSGSFGFGGILRSCSFRERNAFLTAVSGGGFGGGLGTDHDVGAPDTEQVWQQMAPRVYRNLDEIFAGEYEGMTYDEIKATFPDEAKMRAMDKIGYRYPRGESYLDLLSRLDPLIHELESYHEPLLVVAHQAVLRLVYCYLMGMTRAQAPRLEMPLHTVIRITYDGWNPPLEERFYLGPDPKGSDGQTNL